MASENNYVQPAIPRFDDHCDHWSMLMENFLRSKEYWSLVEHGIVEPASGGAMIEAQTRTLEDQKFFGIFRFTNILRTMFIIVRFFRSATPFCCGVYAAVSCLCIPCLKQSIGVSMY